VIPKLLQILLFCFVSTVANSQSALRCEFPPVRRPDGLESIVRPRSADETERMHQAPHGAKRLNKRQLQVNWVGGAHVFEEKPPYDADLDGVRWAYCGYSSELRLHLIMKQDGDLFTGVLLDESNGHLLPGGEDVLFSPNHERYLAFEQPDGQDGETLKLCTRNGTVIWSGYNGILSRDGVSIENEIRDVHWNAQNQVVATASYFDGRTVAVELRQTSKTKWQWLPVLKK
jgi:hypothetical protein